MDHREPRIAGGSPKDQQDPWQDALEGPERGETHSVFGLRDRGRLEARDRENRGLLSRAGLSAPSVRSIRGLGVERSRERRAEST